MMRIKFLPGLLMAMLFLGQACKREGCTDANAVNYDEKARKDDGSCVFEDHPVHITLKFVHEVDGNALQTDTMLYVNAAGNRYQVNTVRYFVSAARFNGAGGNIVSTDEVHYVDAADAGTVHWVVDVHPEPGNYTSVSFIFGMDSLTNHTTVFSNAPESNMIWPDPMGNNNGVMTDDGSHYMKLEGKFIDSTGAVANFNAHTGPSMGKQYFFEVTLPASSFVVGEKDLEIEVKMNINNWFGNPVLYDFNTYGDAVMMNIAAQMALKQNGITDVFAMGSVTEK